MVLIDELIREVFVVGFVCIVRVVGLEGRDMFKFIKVNCFFGER